MQATMERINKLSHERQNLWQKASHGGLTPTEANRVKELTDVLYNLWDQYRREYASRHSQRSPAFVNFTPKQDDKPNQDAA
ncbi:MAG: DUF2630 family protein [Chloroflexota bacterium]